MTQRGRSDSGGTTYDDRERPVYMALQVAELPEPYVSSTQLRCHYCEAPVWVDLKSIEAIERHGWPIICRPCLLVGAGQ